MDLSRVGDSWVDSDPWPRAAPVSPLSPWAALAAARPSDPLDVRVCPADALPAPARTPLRTWWFSAQGEEPVPVAIPDTWSRRDPTLFDFRGPAHYRRAIFSEATHARVVFEGLDYVAILHVDGARLGVHEGGFTPVAVDVPTGREVAVEVVVDDPMEPLLLQPDALLSAKRKIKGVFEQHDSRPGGIPLGPTSGGTSAKRWGTGGMTGAAILHETGPVRIDGTFVTAHCDELRISWVLTNHGAEVDTKLGLTVEGVGLRLTARLVPGANRIAIRALAEGIEPWTPRHPRLYHLRSAVSVGGVHSDADDVTFGVRDVAMETAGPGQLQLRLNGNKTYVRAANYIPGMWLPELREDTVATDMRLAKAANLNSLGVHAHLCPQALQASDREGVLIYQDFPLQWFYDPAGAPLVEGGPTFAEASAWLAAEVVYATYNHPSLVYWCGHNEPAYQLAEAFDGAGLPELAGIGGQMAGFPDEEPLDVARAELLARVDPSRPVTQASGLGMTRDDGDVHDYAGSMSGGVATDNRAGATAFVSEYGAWSANFSAAASVSAARGDWPPPECEPEWAQQTHLYATQCAYAGRPDRFESFQEWCFAGQLWAGWHAKVVAEKARLSKYAPSAGARYHFLVDHWGAAGAGVVDRHRTTGPAFRGLAAANRPVLALAPTPAGGRVAPGAAVRLPIVVVNDTSDDLGVLPLRWRLAALEDEDAFLVGRDDPLQIDAFLPDELSPPDHCVVLPRAPGRTLLSGEVEVEVGADARVDAAEIVWDADVTGPLAVFFDLDGVIGWTSFMVAPDGWQPIPGLIGRRSFCVTSERPAPLRRRWTGDEVDPVAAPPDQYLLGDQPVDVYDDLHVDSGGRVTTATLPWEDPCASRA